MRIIDGLTYTADSSCVVPHSNYSSEWVFRGYYCVKYPMEEFSRSADACKVMMHALGLDRWHMALVTYEKRSGVHDLVNPSARLVEVRDCGDMRVLPFSPFREVFRHYMQYSIGLDQIMKVNHKVVEMARNILMAEGSGLDLVVLSSFAIPCWYMHGADLKAMARQVVCDLRDVFSMSEEPDLQNAAVLAGFS